MHQKIQTKTQLCSHFETRDFPMCFLVCGVFSMITCTKHVQLQDNCLHPKYHHSQRHHHYYSNKILENKNHSPYNSSAVVSLYDSSFLSPICLFLLWLILYLQLPIHLSLHIPLLLSASFFFFISTWGLQIGKKYYPWNFLFFTSHATVG